MADITENYSHTPYYDITELESRWTKSTDNASLKTDAIIEGFQGICNKRHFRNFTQTTTAVELGYYPIYTKTR